METGLSKTLSKNVVVLGSVWMFQHTSQICCYCSNHYEKTVIFSSVVRCY